MTFPRPWKHTVELFDIWDREDIPSVPEKGWDGECKRDLIVARLKELPQYVDDHEHSDFDEALWWIVDELSDVDSEDYFNTVWDAFYDWADYNRVWVNIHHPAKETAS